VTSYCAIDGIEALVFSIIIDIITVFTTFTASSIASIRITTVTQCYVVLAAVSIKFV